jgi:hypothetical protein
MSKDPSSHEEPEELDLEVETVRDLEPDDADGVGGGYQVTQTCHCILTLANCPSGGCYLA